MNNAIVRVSAERGLDPREFALVAFGGNGPVHALAQAADLGIGHVLIPRAAPAFSALGLLVADYLVDKVRATLVTAKEADPGALGAIFEELEAAAEAELKEAGLPARRIVHRRLAQCRYTGQTADLDVPLDRRALTPREVERIAERFHAQHEGFHTYARREEDVVISALRVRSSGVMPKPALPQLRGTSAPPKPKGQRKAFFGGRFRRTAIFDGPALYVTATKVAEIHADQRTGSFWRVDTDASGGLPLLPGKL